MPYLPWISRPRTSTKYTYGCNSAIARAILRRAWLPLSMVLSLTLSRCSTILVADRDLPIPNKSVVLTFDDGPNDSDSTTLRLLHVLSKHNALAYFCVIGQNARQAPEVVRKILSDGHVVVNHCYHDQWLLFRSKDEIENEIVLFDSVMQTIGPGTTPLSSYLRPPYGVYPISLKRILKKRDMHLLPVSFYARDAEVKPNGKSRVLERTCVEIFRRKRAIVVFHDGKDSYQKRQRELLSSRDSKYNRKWVPEIVDSLLTRMETEGYTTVLVP